MKFEKTVFIMDSVTTSNMHRFWWKSAILKAHIHGQKCLQLHAMIMIMPPLLQSYLLCILGWHNTYRIIFICVAIQIKMIASIYITAKFGEWWQWLDHRLFLAVQTVFPWLFITLKNFNYFLGEGFYLQKSPGAMQHKWGCLIH